MWRIEVMRAASGGAGEGVWRFFSDHDAAVSETNGTLVELSLGGDLPTYEVRQTDGGAEAVSREEIPWQESGDLASVLRAIAKRHSGEGVPVG